MSLDPGSFHLLFLLPSSAHTAASLTPCLPLSVLPLLWVGLWLFVALSSLLKARLTTLQPYLTCGAAPQYVLMQASSSEAPPGEVVRTQPARPWSNFLSGHRYIWGCSEIRA